MVITNFDDVCKYLVKNNISVNKNTSLGESEILLKYFVEDQISKYKANQYPNKEIIKNIKTDKSYLNNNVIFAIWNKIKETASYPTGTTTICVTKEDDCTSYYFERMYDNTVETRIKLTTSDYKVFFPIECEKQEGTFMDLFQIRYSSILNLKLDFENASNIDEMFGKCLIREYTNESRILDLPQALRLMLNDKQNDSPCLTDYQFKRQNLALLEIQFGYLDIVKFLIDEDAKKVYSFTIAKK